MSTQTDNFALPIPDSRPESEQSGYAAILAVRNALILLDTLLKDQQDILGTKVGEGTTWEITDIDGLAAALAGKMAASKTFRLRDLTDTAGVADAITGYVLAMMPDGKWSPASAQSLIGDHQHLMSDVQGLVAALAAKADAAATSAALATKANAASLGNAASRNVGTASGTVADGGDSRFTNAREWTAAVVPQAEAEDGTATTARKWTAQRVRQNASAIAIGVGQEWQNVSASRLRGTDYLNNTGRPIQLFIRWNSDASFRYTTVSGSQLTVPVTYGWPFQIIVPAGGKYGLPGSGGVAIAWWELR